MIGRGPGRRPALGLLACALACTQAGCFLPREGIDELELPFDEAEICDEVDDDCGGVDNDCGGVDNDCDGVDNDCDEEIDEGGECGAPCAQLLFAGRRLFACASDPSDGRGLPYDRAAAACASRGQELAVVEDAATQDRLWSLTSSLVAPERASLAGFWIGLDDREIEGDFRLRGGAAPSSFTAWAEGEPDDASALAEGAPDADCVAMRASAEGAWADERCDLPLGWICEAIAAE